VNLPRRVQPPDSTSGSSSTIAFVVGYGLDHDGLYLNLPDIVAIED